MADKVKMIPRWYKDLRDMSVSARKELVEVVLDNLSRHGSLKDEKTEVGKQFVQWIKKEFELIGFAPNTVYLKCEAKGQDLPATWVHPWAMTTLIYKNKKLPFLIYVNAGMRKDEMLLAQIPFNGDVFDQITVAGLTS